MALPEVLTDISQQLGEAGLDEPLTPRFTASKTYFDEAYSRETKAIEDGLHGRFGGYRAEYAAQYERNLNRFLTQFDRHTMTRRFFWLPEVNFSGAPGFRLLHEAGYLALLHLTRDARRMTGILFSRADFAWQAEAEASIRQISSLGSLR